MNFVRNNLVVELHVPDFAPLKHFYPTLGFEVALEDLKTEDYPGYIVFKRKDAAGETILNFYGGDERVYEQAFFKKFARDTPRGYGVEITVPTKEIDKLYERASCAHPTHIVRPLKENTDGNLVWRDFRMEDPFGFYLRFTELVDWGQ